MVSVLHCSDVSALETGVVPTLSLSLARNYLINNYIINNYLIRGGALV